MESQEKAFVSETYCEGQWTSVYIHNKSLREIVQNFSQEEFLTLVALGSNAINTVNNSAASLEYKEALDKEIKSYTQAFEAEKKDLLEKLERSKKMLEDEKVRLSEKFSEEIKLLKSANHNSQETITQLKSQYAGLLEESKKTFKDSLDSLSKEKDIQREQEISRMTNTHQKTIEDLKESARERVAQCDAQYKDSIVNLKASYSEQESRLRRELEKSFASSEKGKQGEMLFEEMAAEHTSWGPLENTSKISHGADRYCKIKGCETLFEIKNYTTDVPSKEVDKFYRDMEEHPEVPLGVFVSQKTNIVGKKSGNFIHVEWTPKSQLLVFINSFSSHSAQDVLTFIDTCVEIALTVFKNFHETPNDSDNTMLLQSRIDMVKSIVEKELKALAEFLNAVNVQKTSLIQTVTKHHVENSLNIKHRKESLNEILAILLGTPQEEPFVEVELVEPKKSRSKKTPQESVSKSK